MAGHGEKFGRKKEEAIAALLTQRNVGKGGPAMRALHRRFLRLENRFGPPVETDYSRVIPNETARKSCDKRDALKNLKI
jgi:hypothetical protein